MLDEFARRICDKLASNKEQNQTFVPAQFAQRTKLSIILSTLLDSVSVPFVTKGAFTLSRRYPMEHVANAGANVKKNLKHEEQETN
jgi:hypothetical protein